MPKLQRAPEEVEAFKNQILDVAMEVMKEDGYKHISMRKVAARMNMTAANLYNYYANKDELNLAIQTRVAVILFDMYKDAFGRFDDPWERLVHFIDLYVEFGISCPNYYDIIYSITAPKYADFVGTAAESVALEEKRKALDAALAVLDINVKAVVELRKMSGDFSAEKARLEIMTAWSTLHGMISLHNRGYFEKMGEQGSDLLGKMKVRVLKMFSEDRGGASLSM